MNCQTFARFSRAGALIFFMSLSVSIYAVDPLFDLNQAEELLNRGEWSLARRYIEPSIHSPRISTKARSHFYYVRGYSFLEQRLNVSAKKDFYRALEFDDLNREALYHLGRIYYYGLGDNQDLPLGISFFRRAADLNHLDAQFHLGFGLMHGRGIKKDEMSGIGLLDGLSEKGHLISILHLADFYRNRSLELDLKLSDEVLDLYEHALTLGSAEAALALGFMYRNGELVLEDLELAHKYFKLAAGLGNRQADVHLAYGYLTGSGVKQNYNLAKVHYLRAAEVNLKAGFSGLAYLYEFGLGLPVNKSIAESFYDLASKKQES